jgi:hypothetical protein
MTLSTDDEIKSLRAYLAQVNDPSVDAPVADARRAQTQYGTAVPLPAGVERTSMILGGVPTERLSPRNTKQHGAFLLLHSGGYSAGTAADHAALAAHLALSADATGYVSEYRRAPEDPLPAAVDDAMPQSTTHTLKSPRNTRGEISRPNAVSTPTAGLGLRPPVADETDGLVRPHGTCERMHHLTQQRGGVLSAGLAAT